MSSEPIRAACITPTGSGGIAVVQVSGPGAAALVGVFLRTARLLDLAHLDTGQLRLCRFVHDSETIDDIMVCRREHGQAGHIVDLCLHGGPRVVERVLLALQSAGASIGDWREAQAHWPGASCIERDALALVLQAKTRPVARWLLRQKELLPPRLERVHELIRQNQLSNAAAELQAIADGLWLAQLLLRGVRVAITGTPNVGKSTLANALAGVEHAIVSSVPGTTRDYVEIETAIEGIPFTLVDTAGIRTTDDAIEQESVRRTRQQLATADLVLHLEECTAEPASGVTSAPAEPERAIGVLTKADLCTAATATRVEPTDRPVAVVSAKTGQGIEQLRGILVSRAGCWAWQDRPAGALTAEQAEACRAAAEALSPPRPDVERAAAILAPWPAELNYCP